MSNNSSGRNPAVVVAKELAADIITDQIYTLSTGVRVKLVPVSTVLIDEVTSRIIDPPVPVWHNPEKDRDEPNPDDPAYAAALEHNSRERGLAIIDAMVMFGVELVDGLPEDDRWLKNLKYMEKRGRVDLSGYDLNDPYDLEFLYKRMIAVDNGTLAKIGTLSNVSQQDVEQAERSFQSNKER